MNNFPQIGINTSELATEVECLLEAARESKTMMGPVNWGDLGIADIEYRLSMLDANATPRCVVLIEEASPISELASWLNAHLDGTRFPNVWIECEW